MKTLTKQYHMSQGENNPKKNRVHIVIPEVSDSQTLCGYPLANMNYKQVGENKKEWGETPPCGRCQNSLRSYRGKGLKNFKLDSTPSKSINNLEVPERHKKAIEKAKDKQQKINEFFQQELYKKEPVPEDKDKKQKNEDENNPILQLVSIVKDIKNVTNQTLEYLCDSIKNNSNKANDIKYFTQISHLKNFIKALEEIENL